MKPPLHRSLSRLKAGLVFLLAALLVGLHIKSFKQPEKGDSSSAPAPVSIQTSDAGPPLETATRRVVNAASDTESSKAFAVTKELRDWLREYKRVAAHNSPFLGDGLAIASRRRAVMRELFVSAPEAALEQSLSIDEYEQAPEQMKPFLEKNFSALGNYTCFPICPGTERPGVLRRRELVPNDLKLSDGSQLKVFVVGARKEIGSKRDLPVQGISLDGLAVMRDGVFQRLSMADAAASRKYFESAQADSSKSFVTGKEISGEPTLALAGGKLFFFESERELVEFDRAVARLDAKPGPRSGSRAIFALPYQADGSTGGFNLQAADMEASAAAADWTLTPKKVFLIRVDFSDKTGDPISKADAEAALNGEVRTSISDMSYGRTTISGTASTMVYRLPQTSAYYADTTAAGYGGESFKSLNDKLLSDAKARFRAERSGADATISIGASDSEYGDYDVVGVTFADIGAYNAGVKYAGLASLGAGDLWMQKSNDAKVYVHEFGHVYGLGHSNFWLTTDGSVVGAGSEKEYGDIYDVMGSGELPRGHFHPQAKKRLLWINDLQWQDASLSGDGSWSFRLHRIDSSDTEQKLRGIRIIKSAAGSTDPEYYWIGYRASYTDNMNLMKGAYLLWQRAGSEKCCLIDSTPATAGEKTDAALFLGRTYSDTAAKAHITTLASGGSLGSEYIDVQINLGTFAGNQSPVLAEVAGPTTGWARANLEFTAPASDVNEDTLSYFWSFSDGTLIGGTGASAAQVAHAFVMGGNYQVSVTVSDMKGGTVTRSKTVTVQDPSQNFAQRDSGTLGDLRSIASNGLLAVAVGTADSSGDSAVIRTSSDGIIWTARGVLESTLNLQLESVHWSGDRFVAVGQDANPPNWYGVIYTSENGVSWTRRYMDSQPGRPLSCVTSGNGVYIAGGEGGSLLSSSDGVLWEAVSLLPSTHKAAGVAFGNGTFVLSAHLFDSQAKAYSGGGKVYTSENALQWQDRTAGAGIDASWQDLRSIAFLNDRFIASGWYSKLRFSTDGGKTFSTTRTRNEEADVLSYHDGLYFALGTERVGSGSSASTSQVALYSNDGANWSQSSSFVLGGSGGAVVNGRILIVGDGGYIWQSDPLDTAASNIPPVISSVQVPASPIARKVLAFGVQASDPNNDNLHYSWDAGDGFGAGSGAEFSYSWLVGGTYTVSVTAADGRGGSKTETRAISISDPLMPFSARGTATGALNAIAASGSLAVAVGDKGIIKTSADAVEWVDRSLNPNPNNLYFYSVAWDGSKFIAAGKDFDFTAGVNAWVGVVYTSSDGVSWSRVYASTTPGTILRKVGCGNGISFAGGDMGTLLRSANGNAWSPVQLVAGSYDIGGIAYGQGKFAILAHQQGSNSGDGKAFVSSDGSNWEDRSSALDFDNSSWQDLRNISFANDRFIASGWYSKIRVAMDAAQTFVAVRSEPENIDSVVHGNGVYVGVGKNQSTSVDLLFFSQDGMRWEPMKAPVGWEAAKSAAFFKDSILLVGGGSLIAQSAIFAPDLGSPTLLSQPLSAAVNPGASVTLSVTATGTGVLNYQWKKSGVNLNGGTTSTYTINLAAESNEGEYTVVVSNDAGTVTSTAATVSVNDPVVIIAQPVSTVVNPGAPVSLSVNATGSEVLSYQWKKGGINLSGGTGATYAIGSAAESNEGEYTVVVSNVVGPVTSTTATVSVNDPVVITAQPVSAVVNPGAPVSLSVNATGSGVLSYQWKKGGINLSGGTGATYTIGSAAESNEGEYTVVVGDEAGTVTSTVATISVNDPVAITAQPVSTVVNPGAPVSLSVNATGSGVLSYQWKKGGINLSGGTEATYAIGSAAESNEGEYTVVVSNVVGPVTSTTVTVSVNDPVVITAQPMSTVVNPGAPVSLSVNATGSGVLSYQWKKGGVNLNGGTGATYAIGSAAESNEGEYTVVVSNVVGPVTSMTATVSVNDPLIITAQPVGAVVNPGAPMSLSVNATGSGVLSYQWKKGGVDLSGGTGSTYVIASAEESNEGEYTVVVSNIVGPVTSTTAIVSVNDRVVITAQPVKSVVTVGGTVSLSVTATGTGPLLYQWKKGNQDISGETLPMLKITSAQLTDSGSYQVIVQGTAGSVASNPALVTVNPARIQAVVGEALTWTLPADPNVSSYSVTRLPPGLLFDANAGTISGTPHRAGVWVVQIKGVNGVSIVRSAQLPIQVAPLNAGLVGRFNGLVAKSAELNDNLGSRIDCVVSSSGVVSGRLISSKGSAAFIGSLKTTLSNPTEATLSVPVSLFGSGQNLQLDLLFDASSQRISGEVVLKSSVANPQSAAVAVVSGWGNSWGRFRAAGYAGDYRFHMMPDSSPADSPQGYGYGSAFVSRETGGVSLWGSLADSQRISSACALGPSGEVLMYSTLYGGSGSCVGAVSLEKGAIVPVENTIAGSLNWSKKGWGARGAKVSPQNFEATLEVQGRFFRSANSRLLNLQSARRSVGAQLGIGLTEWINQPVNLQVAGGVQIRVLIPSNIYAFKMQTIDRQVGFFSGGFEIPPASLQGQKRQASFSGQIVNDVQDSKGYGFFLAPREPEAGAQLDTSILYSGKVTLDVP